MEDLKDLRPIILVGGLYKILSKVLANRIKRVMVRIISQSQSGFVEGRQILDAVLIANEVVDSILRRKECGLVCKLDIEKVYDSIIWDYLYGSRVAIREGEGEVISHLFYADDTLLFCEPNKDRMKILSWILM